jgi:hypothetical protein
VLADDFNSFFNTRMKALAGLISEAMGKAVVEDSGVNEAETDSIDADDESDPDDAAVAA